MPAPAWQLKDTTFSDYWQTYQLRGYRRTCLYELNTSFQFTSSAYQAVMEDTGTPKIGDTNEGEGFYYCKDIKIRPLAGKTFEVVDEWEGLVLDYSSDDLISPKLWYPDSKSVQELSNFDRYNRAMVVPYVPPVAENDLPAAKGKAYKPHIPDLPRYYAVETRRVVLYSLGRLTPEKWQRKYTGMVNEPQWNEDPERTWLCMGFRIEPLASGKIYRVVGEWLYNPRTWDRVAVYLSPFNTKQPGMDDLPTPENYVDSVVGLVDSSGNATGNCNGWRRFQMQGTIDFSNDFDPTPGDGD